MTTDFTMFSPVSDHHGAIARLNELAVLQPGWYDGEGSQIDHEGVMWFHGLLHALHSAGYPAPKLYPTPEGGVEGEWDEGACHLAVTWMAFTSQIECLSVDCDPYRTGEHLFSTSINDTNRGDYRQVLAFIDASLR